jgi:hypothetical protein
MDEVECFYFVLAKTAQHLQKKSTGFNQKNNDNMNEKLKQLVIQVPEHV